MANEKANPKQPKGSGTNPNVNSEAGGINPSAPSVGTEGWGTTADEREVLSGTQPAETRAGQMKGNPGDDRTSVLQRMGQGENLGENLHDESRGTRNQSQPDLSRHT